MVAYGRMAISNLIAALFLLCIVAAGYTLGAVVLGWNNRFAVIGMMFIGGMTLLMIAVNMLGHLFPIQIAIQLGFVLLLLFDLVGLVHFFCSRKKPKDIPPQWATWTLLCVAVCAGLVGARFLGSDHMIWTHFPLPATIMHGNFPVMEPMNPWQIVGYHYIPALFVTIVSSLTGLSLAASYAWQPLVGAGAMLFFAAALARKLGASWKVAVIVGILAYAGDGLTWLKGFFLAQDLWQHFILGQAVDVPFGNLTPSLTGWSIARYLGHRPTTLGVPLFFAALYCMADILSTEANNRMKKVVITLCIFLLAIALTTETTYALFGFGAVLYLLCGFTTSRKNIASSRVSLLWIIGAMALSLIIARFQGGLLTAFPQGDSPSFTLALDGRLYTYASERFIMLWDIRVWRDFGFPVLLLPFALFFAWKKWRTQPFLLLIGYLVLLHLIVPFIVRYIPRPTDMYHMFHAGIALASFLVGYWLLTDFMPEHRRNTIAGWVIIVCMLITSTSYLLVRGFTPNFRFQPEPLFAHMPAITPEQREMYDWVRRNTTQKDWFYTGSLLAPPANDEEDQQGDRVWFMAHTGRFTIGPMSWDNTTESTKEKLRTIEATCDLIVMNELQIHYLLVETDERLQWFQKHCNEADWELVYQGVPGFPRIYEQAVIE